MTQYLTRHEARLIDERAVRDYGMTGLVLMENAGRGCTDVLCQLGIDGPVFIYCGKGNNGGDGLVIARHLHIRGYEPRLVLCCEPAALSGDAAANYEIAQRAALPILLWDEQQPEEHARALGEASWAVDALLGTGASGEPRGSIAEAIQLLNASSTRTLAVDTPSGLDCDTGVAAQQTVRAEATCTFVAAKAGFRFRPAAAYLGTVYVVDIGVPRAVWQSPRSSAEPA